MTTKKDLLRAKEELQKVRQSIVNEIFKEFDKICIPVPKTMKEMDKLVEKNERKDFRIVLLKDLNKLKETI